MVFKGKNEDVPPYVPSGTPEDWWICVGRSVSVAKELSNLGEMNLAEWISKRTKGWSDQQVTWYARGVAQAVSEYRHKKEKDEREHIQRMEIALKELRNA